VIAAPTMQPGLPPLVVDLLVCCFAIQSGTAWLASQVYRPHTVMR
jgi:hypothetical protein